MHFPVSVSASGSGSGANGIVSKFLELGLTLLEQFRRVNPNPNPNPRTLSERHSLELAVAQ